MKRHLFIITILGLLANACGNKTAPDKQPEQNERRKSTVSYVVGVGKIEPENEIVPLASPVGGIVQRILKNENDTVTPSMPVIELDHRIEDEKITQLTRGLNSYTWQIKADEASIEDYDAKYKSAVVTQQRLQRLFDKGAETKQVLEDAQTTATSYLLNLKKMQAVVASEKSKLDQMKAEIRTAELERDQRIIRSPVRGKILEISTLIGSAVSNRDVLAQISPAGRITATCEVDEMYADRVTVGQKAWIRNVGETDTLSTGTVYAAQSFLKKKSLFTDQAGEREDRRVREVRIMLDQPGKLLLNARVECVIDISQQN